MKAYIPIPEVLLSAWLQRLDDNIDTYAATLNISPAMVAAIKAGNQSAIDAIGAVLAARSDLAGKVAIKNTAVASAVHLVRDQVALFKKQPGYTEAIGEALGVVPSDNPFDPNTYQARILSAVNTAPGGVVKLRFSKAHGNISGINLYYRLQGQTAFQLVGFRQNTPFLDDTTPLAQPNVPEVREYQAIAVISDVEIGIPSDIVAVTVR